MRPEELIRQLEEAIEQNPNPGRHDMGLTLVATRSPGPVLGVRCERLGPAKGGTAWNVPARSLVKALAHVRAELADRGINP